MRAQETRIEAKLKNYECNEAADVRYSWKVVRMPHLAYKEKFPCLNVDFSHPSAVINDKVGVYQDGRVVVIPPLFLAPGNYCLDVEVCLI